MLLAAFDSSSESELPWNTNQRKRKRRRSFEDDGDMQIDASPKKKKNKRRRTGPPLEKKPPAVLSVSRRKRKRRTSEDSCSTTSSSEVASFGTRRKKQMVAFENGSGVAGLEAKLENLKIGKKDDGEKMETDNFSLINKNITNNHDPSDIKNSCTAIVPIIHRDFKKHLTDLEPPSIFTVDRNILAKNSTPKMNAKQITSSVLKVLVQLGFVEKLDCYGEDIYVVLRERFEPLFTRPTSYYFQNIEEIPSFVSRLERQKKPMDTKTLVGLWLLFVKLGYFLPFPQVQNYTHLFQPVNESRLEKLGASWLKQLGITEEMLTDPVMMDLICKKIVLGLRHGKGRLTDGDADDGDAIMIEAVS